MVGIEYKYAGHWSSEVVRVMLEVVEGRVDIQEKCHISRNKNYFCDVMGQPFLSERF